MNTNKLNYLFIYEGKLWEEFIEEEFDLHLKKAQRLIYLENLIIGEDDIFEIK